MEPIKISVTGAQILVQSAPVITCGMVGLPVEIEFDETWSQLEKTLVYKAGEQILDQMQITNRGVVPGQLLTCPYKTLQIGVYGVSGDGSLVIPTVWAQVGIIREGADPSGDPGADPELPVWQTLLDRVQELENTRPKLLWEFTVPELTNIFLRLTWNDDYAFGFSNANGPKLWNDDWRQDIILEPNTTIVEKFAQLFDLVQTTPNVVLEFTVNGLFKLRAHPVAVAMEAEGVRIWKLTVQSGLPGQTQTPNSDMAVLEISNDSLAVNLPVGSVAAEDGWSVCLYG